jgi:dTDP-4-dehydrorhamnose 3,5-epimerase
MKFIETKLKGACNIEPERLEDERCFFVRSFCQNESEAHGLNPRVVQCNISYNKREGTLRGVHYQVAPMAEAELARSTSGAIYDVIIDLRLESPIYCPWAPVELTDDNRRMLYIPEGFAHGFQTLEGDTEVFYQRSEFYTPNCVRDAQWDDLAFGIEWPLSSRIISKKDMSYQFLGDK